MERVIALRKVPLLAGLSPAELSRVAGIADEHTYADGDVIAREGEIGDELHIVVAGAVEVVREQDGATLAIARREAGDVVGEMSIITRGPRVASLVAEGDVRTVRIGRQEFESIIRERPDVSLAVMRVLAERLSVETTGRAIPGVV
jgi:CRP-like cAMP-binding protein